MDKTFYINVHIFLIGILENRWHLRKKLSQSFPGKISVMINYEQLVFLTKLCSNSKNNNLVNVFILMFYY